MRALKILLSKYSVAFHELSERPARSPLVIWPSELV